MMGVQVRVERRPAEPGKGSGKTAVVVFFLPFGMLEAEPRPSYVLGMHSTTEPHPYSKVSPLKSCLGLNPTERLPEVRHTSFSRES